MNLLNQKILNEYVFFLKKVKYKNIIQTLKLEYCLDEDGDYVYLVIIVVKKSKRKMGYGNSIMKDIIQLANNYNVRIKLWVSDMYGTDYNVLFNFYKKHGFKLINDKNEKEMIFYPKKK